MLTKICGMRELDNIVQLDKLAPDYLGFIFYSHSPRYVGEDFILPSTLHAKRVGVFVDAEIDFVVDKVSVYHLDVVQLHGGESVTYCQELRQACQATIWKAVSVDSSTAFDAYAGYAPAIDCFLFDTKTDTFGGSGESFDWKLLSSYDGNVDFIVAGGLGVENAIDAKTVLSSHPRFVGLDFNSKLEERPGVKSVAQVAKLMELVRA